MLKRITLVAAVVLACSATAASAASYSGTLNGSNYSIEVPANWNGTLVVLAHGYRDKADHPGEVDDTSSGDAGLRLGLASAGYAVADTSYRTNGWAVKEMITDVADLAEYFEANIATPQRSLLAGFSLGSFPTAERAERGGFDGYLPMCGVLAGAPRAWDGAGAHLLAYQTAFGSMPASWGTPADGDDDVDAETEVFGTLVGNLGSPGGIGKFEFARIVAGVPLSPAYYPGGLFTNMFFQTEARGELERRAGGPVTQNLDHTYWVSPGDRVYLGAFGVSTTQIDTWLATMNSTRYSAPSASRNWVEHYATFTGKIKQPVLTMHTAIDTLVPVNHEAAYRDTVAAAGRSALLRQWYTNGTSHCGFSFPQILSAVNALDAWVATGTAPAGPPAAVPGFLPAAYSPPAWPQP
jgi:dienelactone hydrolase